MEPFRHSVRRSRPSNLHRHGHHYSSRGWAKPCAGLVTGNAHGYRGGALRDILAAEVPLVLRSEIYAVASLIGAIIIAAANQAQILGPPAEILAATATFA